LQQLPNRLFLPLSRRPATPHTWSNKMADTSKTVVMPVTGMSCAACQVHIERALRETPGVRDAQVNLMSHRAHVTYDPALARPGQLIDAVREAGYGASLPAEHGHDHD